jgi:hypothetical protein
LGKRVHYYLLFTANTETGEILPTETAQKLMQLPAMTCEQHPVLTSSDIEESLNIAKHDLLKTVNARNLLFFEEEVNKLDYWADDLKFGLEQSIKEIDVQIKEVRRNAKIAVTLEEKLNWQKKQRDLEQTRTKQRKELFDRQDEVDDRREVLIEKLESKLNQKTQVEDLFVIRWCIQ